MRNAILTIAIVTAIALTYSFGNRLSSQASVAVAAALCGITAGIPVSLALFIAASRNWGRSDISREEPTQRAPRPLALRQRRRGRAVQPRVVVISPPRVTRTPYPFQPNPIYSPPTTLALAAPREFKIVGDD
jgi:hypothetical protein